MAVAEINFERSRPSFETTQFTEGLFGMIEDAHESLQDPRCLLQPTNLFIDHELSDRYSATVVIASECTQPSKAYKGRGAWNKMRSLDTDTPAVTSSTGNNAAAVAHTANSLGIDAVVFMPEGTPEVKIKNTKKLGGKFVEVREVGETFDDTNQAAQSYCQETGASFVHPFDDLEVIAGQGTLGLEAVNRLQGLGIDHVDAVFCPVGGGGLSSGVFTAVRNYFRECKLFGVEPEGAASMTHALKNLAPRSEFGRTDTTTKSHLLEDIEEVPSLDGPLDKFVDAAAVKQVGRYPLAVYRALGADILTASNNQVRKALTELEGRLDHQQRLVEAAAGLGYVGLSQIFEEDPDKIRGSVVLVTETGANVDRTQYLQKIFLPEVALAA